jgi:hypothetical protein
MKKISIVLFILLGTLLVSACGAMAAQPVEALAVDTATAAIIAPSSTSTDTPMPTETLVPASPTASRMEFSVQSASLEIKVLDIDKPYRVHLGWDSYLGKEISFTPGAGQMFLALGVKVNNLTGADIPMKWTDLYLVNKYQEKWYPTWGAYQKTNSAMDPLMVEILKYDQVHPDFDPDAHFYASDNGFLRVIFRVPKDNLYYFFGFADLPLIEINWRYY